MTSLADRPARASSWYPPVPWRVVATHRESHDTVTVDLTPADGSPYRFRPGQFNMLYAFGVGEAPISVSGDPDSPAVIRHTIRDVGAVTRALCALRPGERAGLRGPYGTHWPLAEAEGGDLVLVAGGLGLPPLRPALYHLLAHRDQFSRIVLLYGARSPTDLLFTRELAEWRRRPDLEVHVTVDVAAGGWRGNVGVVPDLVARAGFDPQVTTALLVGPEVMMRFGVRALRAAGVASERIFLSMERNMQCAAAMCGHCQLGPFLVCRDGPVFGYPSLARWLQLREV